MNIHIKGNSVLGLKPLQPTQVWNKGTTDAQI